MQLSSVIHVIIAVEQTTRARLAPYSVFLSLPRAGADRELDARASPAVASAQPSTSSTYKLLHIIYKHYCRLLINKAKDTLQRKSISIYGYGHMISGPVRICQFMHSIFRFFDDI